MNKQELVAKVMDATGLSRVDAAQAVQAVFESITEALRGGEEVRVVGFGSFAVSTRKASIGRNPRTGEPMEIAACAIPKFRPGKEFRDACN
ncbi:MAG: HU family DNA-binding protein [Bosea sp. (in: a-proteobacteria)]